jgi:mRNA-degrading endonuclease RelE of RelBE toxin-antitoxin system
MEFIEAPAFSRYVSDYLGDDDYRKLQSELANNPDSGDLIPGTGGFRKLRWADSRRGKGRRGGLRIIYYFFVSDQQIWLVTLYDKNEAADLTPKQKKTLKSAVEAELQTRKSRQRARNVRLRRIW